MMSSDLIASNTTKRPALIIVGNGMVSHALCSKLVILGLNQNYQVIVFGEEPRPAYDRVRLSHYFTGQSAQALELASRNWYEENDIILHTGVQVVRIDRNRQQLHTSSDELLDYSRLVLCTGSRPFVPPIEGTDLAGVFVYRTIEDLEAIRDYSKNVTSAAVLGGGLLGLEAAKALYDLKLNTHVVEMAPGLMPRQLDAVGGRVLKEKIEELGVHIHLLKRTESITAEQSRRFLNFDRGPALDVEMIVISAGIRPRDELARECELEIGPRGGILVDDQLQTSDPNIFAIGECAAHRGTVYGLVAPGYQMADVLADNLANGSGQFEHGDQSARLKLLGVKVATLGEPLGETPNATTIAWQDESAYRKLIFVKGRIVGAMSVGPWDELDRIQQTIAAGQRLWKWNVKRFESTGRLWRTGVTRRVVDWPDSAIVCSCMRVARGVLSKAKSDGCDTVELLAAKTGASTVCGSCESLLCELVGTSSNPPFQKGRTLLVASLLAVAVLLAWFSGPVPFAQTVQGGWRQVDAIWRDSFFKQVTGFSLLGLTAIGLVLSLRKRLTWISFGKYSSWRAAHAVIGTMTLVGMVIHTGMHLGSNTNFLLATTFLSLNLLGAATGITTAFEQRASGDLAIALRRWRPRFTQLHIWLFLPLPVLLVIHIACVYYY
ncbi:MAG: nitrite reductase (NADH) large subunit [Pirellulaceae bacterium]|jgi:nitrite reductase (NADH) large subunit